MLSSRKHTSSFSTQCVCVCALSNHPWGVFSRYGMTFDLRMTIARAWKQFFPVPPHWLDIFSLIHSKYLKISNRLQTEFIGPPLSRLFKTRRTGPFGASQSGRQGNIVAAPCQRNSRCESQEHRKRHFVCWVCFINTLRGRIFEVPTHAAHKHVLWHPFMLLIRRVWVWAKQYAPTNASKSILYYSWWIYGLQRDLATPPNAPLRCRRPAERSYLMKTWLTYILLQKYKKKSDNILHEEN